MKYDDIDRIIAETNRRLVVLDNRVRDMQNLLAELDRSVECYVFATKGERQVHIPEA